MGSGVVVEFWLCFVVPKGVSCIDAQARPQRGGRGRFAVGCARGAGGHACRWRAALPPTRTHAAHEPTHARPPPPARQVWRVLREHPHISEDRMLSEIGMLFVEGFETTGEALA